MPRFFVTASQIGSRPDGTKTVLIVGDDAYDEIVLKSGVGLQIILR